VINISHHSMAVDDVQILIVVFWSVPIDAAGGVLSDSPCPPIPNFW
jgi:hypothetical protein